jgi:hypothetical protein
MLADDFVARPLRLIAAAAEQREMTGTLSNE